jgi:acyl-coenzyme A synthetase/AMP-(fatty) acid ligase
MTRGGSLATGIAAVARDRLIGFKVRKTLDFDETLPRNPAGKIERGKVRAPYWAGGARQI